MKAVGIIILSTDRSQILLAKRSADKDSEKGKWENVGGKVEEGETFEQAVSREAREELGIEITSMKEILEYGSKTSSNHVKVFEAKIKGTPKIMEPELCEEIRWFQIRDLATVVLADYSGEDFKRLGWL